MAQALPDCELLVVGAGPAGCRAAAQASDAGVNTLLIDAKRCVGEPSHCGEFVPKKVFSEFNIPYNPVVQSVLGMETRVLGDLYSDGGTLSHQIGQLACPERRLRLSAVSISGSAITDSPGFLIERVRFDRELAHEAAQRGAYVLNAARLCARDNDDGWVFARSNKTYRVNPKYVIAADGAASTVARLLKLPSHDFVVGAQLYVPLVGLLDRTLVFLDKQFHGGYGWVFPKGLAANVGIGVAMSAGMRPQQLLHEFMKYLVSARIVKHSIFGNSSGLIPVSGLRKHLVLGNVLFSGDAAGLTHPITGAGVGQALISGDLAGKHAASAIKSRDYQHILDYESELKNHFASVMGHALSKRRMMMEQWDSDDFPSLCEKFWVAFKGYKRRSYD
jgi:geranylgeranyl reductase family protein